MTPTTDTDEFDWDSLVLEAKARFTLEEAIARRDAFNATVSDDEL